MYIFVHNKPLLAKRVLLAHTLPTSNGVTEEKADLPSGGDGLPLIFVDDDQRSHFCYSPDQRVWIQTRA